MKIQGLSDKSLTRIQCTGRRVGVDDGWDPFDYGVSSTAPDPAEVREQLLDNFEHDITMKMLPPTDAKAEREMLEVISDILRGDGASFAMELANRLGW